MGAKPDAEVLATLAGAVQLAAFRFQRVGGFRRAATAQHEVLAAEILHGASHLGDLFHLLFDARGIEQSGAHMEADEWNAALSDLLARRLRIGEAAREAGEISLEAFVTEIVEVGKRGEKLRPVAQRGAPGAGLASQANTRAGSGAGQGSQAREKEFPPAE